MLKNVNYFYILKHMYPTAILGRLMISLKWISSVVSNRTII
jgi:hypothetical protein